MDITKFNFQDVSAVDIAFPTMGADPELLKEAKERGFYTGDTKYNKMFSHIFFSGGKLKFKEGLDPDFVNKAFPYMKCLMGSFAPKHEEKEAICAILLSELCE